MSRLSPLDLDSLTSEQQTVADAIRGSRGALRGPFEPWLRRPGLASPAQELGAYCRFSTSLPRDLVEFVILLTGKRWRAQFEFWAHARMAREAGLPEAVIEAVRTGAEPPLEREDLRAAHALVGEYFATSRVSEATYRGAVAALGEEGIVDVVGIVGYYGLVSMTLNVFEVELPDGETPLP